MNLHSTMFLLNPEKMLHLQKHRYDLHSTMFLLNLRGNPQQFIQQANLHSTMFLLNRTTEFTADITVNIFTFHYVSIKSYVSPIVETIPSNLHSTMFLLNLTPLMLRSCLFIWFTFHYVSIKSTEREAIKEYNRMIYIPLCFY